MANLEECIKFAVGLSQNDCGCFSNGRPEEEGEEYNRSDSGYYLDDQRWGIPLKFTNSATDCGDDGLWEVLDKARTQGIRDAFSAFSVAAKEQTRIAINPWDGYIGDEKGNQFLSSISKTYPGVILKPNSVYKGALLKLKKILFWPNLANSYAINVYKSNDPFTAIRTYPVTVSDVSKPTQIDVDPVLELPLSEYDRGVNHYFLYDRKGSYPRNFLFNCNCNYTVNKYQWEQYITGFGIQMNDLGGVTYEKEFSTYTNGLRLLMSLECDGYEWMCRDWNWKMDPWARTLANFIQLFSIQALMGFILSSGRVNFYTVIKAETMIQKMTDISQSIERIAPWLVYNIPRGLTSCWECTEKGTMTKRTISV